MAIGIDLSGKVALVTGASRGIGSAIATVLHQAGAKVAVNHPGLEPTAAEAQRLIDSLETSQPGSSMAVAADVASPDEIERMMDAIVNAWGKIDILVNNAGILRDRTVAKMSVREWDEVIAVNLSGVFHCSRLGLARMNDGGAIVNMASVSGLGGFFGQANYAAAKAGVIALTKTLARESARRKIRCNAIAPGVVETAMAATIPETARNEMRKAIPWDRFGSAEEIAGVALFLCSDLASYVTGETIVVSGGWMGW